MRRLWILRFTWLLWLASLGTAFLPLAHDLSHRHGLPLLVDSNVLAAQADIGSVDDHAPSEAEPGACLVCAHLGSQYLSLPEGPPRLPGPLPLPFGQVSAPQEGPALLVAWLRPGPRAPPVVSLL